MLYSIKQTIIAGFSKIERDLLESGPPSPEKKRATSKVSYYLVFDDDICNDNTVNADLLPTFDAMSISNNVSSSSSV